MMSAVYGDKKVTIKKAIRCLRAFIAVARVQKWFDPMLYEAVNMGIEALEEKDEEHNTG